MASSTSSSSSTPLPKSAVEKIRKAVEYKKLGNASFVEGDLQTAMRHWHDGLLHTAGINSFASMYGAKSSPAQNEKAQELTNAFRSNLAACYIKQERWDKAVYATTKVLEVDPDNFKARYRRSLAYLRLKDTQRAASDLDRALERAPNDPSVRRLALELVEQEEDRVAKIKEQETAKADSGIISEGRSKKVGGMHRDEDE